MKPAAIRRIVSRRPFRPLEIWLDNGRRHLITHPEAIIVADEDVAFLPRGARSIVWVAPEAVSEVRPVPRNVRPARKT